MSSLRLLSLALNIPWTVSLHLLMAGNFAPCLFAWLPTYFSYNNYCLGSF